MDTGESELEHSAYAVRRFEHDGYLRPFPDRRKLPDPAEHQLRLYTAVEVHPEIRSRQDAYLPRLRKRILLVQA